MDTTIPYFSCLLVFFGNIIKMIVYYRLRWGTLVQRQHSISLFELYYAEVYYSQREMYAYAHLKNSSYLENNSHPFPKGSCILDYSINSETNWNIFCMSINSLKDTTLSKKLIATGKINLLQMHGLKT